MQLTGSPEIRVRRFAARADLDRALAERLSSAATDAASAIMLSGGTTPGPAFALAAERGVRAAPGLRVLYSDERHVPSTAAASNYHLSQPLLAALALPAEQVLRVRTELPLAAAAQDYEERLQGLLDAKVRIRLGLLGLGADGHTASLFTPVDLEEARLHLAISVQRPDGRSAVTVTPDFLAQVEEILFVVAGADKTPALKRLHARDPSLTAWRAVARAPQVQVWADTDAWPP
jgi:6-phosphogluconolactonase